MRHATSSLTIICRLLDEMGYVPTRHYAQGPEIFAHCQAIARRYNLYELAVFQTTVTSTIWDEAEQMWNIATDRGDHLKARFVICANGTLSKPKLSKIKGMESFKGHSFHTSRWDYEYTKADLSGLEDKVVGIIGTGATAVQAIPSLGAAAKELYMFPAHAFFDRHSRTIGRPIRNGRGSCARDGRPSGARRRGRSRS